MRSIRGGRNTRNVAKFQENLTLQQFKVIQGFKQLLTNIGFRKFLWISWISIFRRTRFDLSPFWPWALSIFTDVSHILRQP